MKAQDLRERSVADLKELSKTLAKDLFQARMKNFTNRLDKTSTLGETRRTLARIETVIRQKALGLEPVKGTK
jgi:large subunit ribosomal protein L29